MKNTFIALALAITSIANANTCTASTNGNGYFTVKTDKAYGSVCASITATHTDGSVSWGDACDDCSSEKGCRTFKAHNDEFAGRGVKLSCSTYKFEVSQAEQAREQAKLNKIAKADSAKVYASFKRDSIAQAQQLKRDLIQQNKQRAIDSAKAYADSVENYEYELQQAITMAHNYCIDKFCAEYEEADQLVAYTAYTDSIKAYHDSVWAYNEHQTELRIRQTQWIRDSLQHIRDSVDAYNQYITDSIADYQRKIEEERHRKMVEENERLYQAYLDSVADYEERVEDSITNYRRMVERKREEYRNSIAYALKYNTDLFGTFRTGAGFGVDSKKQSTTLDFNMEGEMGVKYKESEVSIMLSFSSYLYEIKDGYDEYHHTLNNLYGAFAFRHIIQFESETTLGFEVGYSLLGHANDFYGALTLNGFNATNGGWGLGMKLGGTSDCRFFTTINFSIRAI